MLLQHAADAAQAGAHPLSGTVAEYLWLLPLLPLLGFLLNGALSLASAYHAGPADPDGAHGDGHSLAGTAGHSSDAAHVASASGGGAHGDDHHPVVRHRFATLSSLIGPGVLALSFLLAIAMFVAMRAAGGGEMQLPFVQSYFSWNAASIWRSPTGIQLK